MPYPHFPPQQQPAALFELVGIDEKRDDLASRRELKYVQPNADIGKLRRLLAANCRRQRHAAADVSVVRSIYFDDLQLSSCRANVDGVGQRIKLRLRWYDSVQPQHDVYFEVKWRRNRVTGKHRFQLHAHRPVCELSYRELLDGLIEMAPSNGFSEPLAICQPVVLVEYQREHFVTDNGIRITLDYHLRYYDQVGKQFISTRFGRPDHALTVIEGKTPIGRHSELQALLYPFTPRIAKCSKYVHGCHALGHLSEQ